MAITINGTTGISGVDGSASTPAVQGTDTNTGIFFPAADTIAFGEGGAEVARFNADAQFVAAAGTASLPVITTTGDVNTGIFFPAADTIAFAEGGAEVVRIDSSGNIGQNTSSPATYDTSGKMFTQTGTANNSGPVAHMMQGSSANPGAGYYCREVFALAGISNTATEITRITGTGSNGVSMYVRVTVSGHTSSIGNGMNYKGVNYFGGTSAVTQVETATSGSVPTITFDTATNNVLVIKLASAGASQDLNGVMVVEWYVPVDFSSNTWTIS